MFYIETSFSTFFFGDWSLLSQGLGATLQLGQQELTRQASFELNTAGIPVAPLGFVFRSMFGQLPLMLFVYGA